VTNFSHAAGLKAYDERKKSFSNLWEKKFNLKLTERRMPSLN
jgi:hypothetical protein